MKLFHKSFLFVLIYLFSFQFSVAQSELIPPGTLKINDSLFIDSSPITNLMYQEFLFHLENDNPEILESVSIFRFLKIDDRNTATYFFYPKYQYFPVLQITKYQADLYCKWRSDMVQYLWDTKYPDNNKSVLYSLPTKSLYESAVKVFKGTSRFKAFEADNPLKLKIKEHPKKKFVTYNISEITQDDLFFGDNWKGITPKELPNTYTGFRCICEVKTK